MEVNYIAVLIAAVVNMGVGALWYSPLLFAKPWMKLTGIKAKEVENSKKNGMAKEMVLTFVSGIFLAFALAVLINKLEINTGADGALTGLLASLGFVATTMFPNYLFENKPLMLWKINVGYPIVSMTLMGAILALF